MSAREPRRNPLLVLLMVNGRCHALPATHVVEVLPWMPAQPVPLAPQQITGMLNYRGQWTPVVDLSRLLGGEECPRWLSSRTVIVSVGEGLKRLIGLQVEACELHQSSDRAIQPGLRLPDAPFVGEVLADGDRLIQLLRPDDLLDTATLDALACIAPSDMRVGAIERGATQAAG